MLGDRIKMLRKSLKLNQEEFSAKLGMSSSSVYEWEHNRVEIKESTILLIEFVYNVNPNWLRNGEGEMFLPESTVGLTPEAERIFKWIKSLSPQEQAWLDIEMNDKIEKYKNWRKNG